MTNIDAAVSYIRSLFRADAGGHDAGHTLRVWRTAMRIADTEPSCDREIVALAALLHDADDRKLFHTENNANARAFLQSIGMPEDRAGRICQAINGRRPARAADGGEPPPFLRQAAPPAGRDEHRRRQTHGRGPACPAGTLPGRLA